MSDSKESSSRRKEYSLYDINDSYSYTGLVAVDIVEVLTVVLSETEGKLSVYMFVSMVSIIDSVTSFRSIHGFQLILMRAG